jgi:MFS transporter, MHS family, citrate/tricarballylate:H+ symporter
MLIVQLWLSFLFGSYQGARPAISTALIEFTGHKAAPGLWMAVAAVSASLATLMVYRGGEASRNAIAAAK